MPAQGVSTREMSEGRTQLLWGALIIAFFGSLYFGKKLAGVPTPFGIDLGNTTILAFDALWLAIIVWGSVSPPTDRNAWVLAAYIIFFPLSHFLSSRPAHPPVVVATCDLVVAIAGVVGGLSILVRRLWGAR
jgi:hypothetical protein